MSDLPCINQDVSLFDLIRKRQDLIRRKQIGHNNPFIVESIRVSLSDVNAQIKDLETAAKTGTVSIRLM